MYSEENERWMIGSDANFYYDWFDYSSVPFNWPFGGCGRRLEPYIGTPDVWFCPRHPGDNRQITLDSIGKPLPLPWADYGTGKLSYMVPQFSAMDFWVTPLRDPLPQPSQVAFQKDALHNDFLTKVYTGTGIKTPLLVDAFIYAGRVPASWGNFHRRGCVFTRRAGSTDFYKFDGFPLPETGSGKATVEQIWQNMATP